MQRSRKAFLSRKALDFALRNNWHKFSVSLVAVLFWLLPFLVNFYIANSLSHIEKPEYLNDKTCWREANSGLIKGFFLGAEFPSADTCSLSAHWDSHSTRAYMSGSGSEKQSEEEFKNDGTVVKEQVEADSHSQGRGSVKDKPKSDRLVRDAPLGFDEFKSKAINPKGKPATQQAGIVTHRVEPGGTEYNFASGSKGAKVLAVNKEAKGASNILEKDMDKYLRNPCSAEEKFVVIELSEETLVDTIEIANFEHHSSNLKDFELLGSLVYPTESWVELGNFTAKNVKQTQRFTLQEPKWVRYLKLALLSHYGSEFYCTLSTVQVYGVDAIERMLEDLISVQDNIYTSEESTEELREIPPEMTHSQIDGQHQNHGEENDAKPAPDNFTPKHDATIKNMGDQVGDLRQQPAARMPGDSVLKILTQKVRSLDLNLSVLERYLEELNAKYGNIFGDFEKEIAEKDELLKKMRSDLMDIGNRKDIIGKDVQDIMSWKLLVSSQMDILEKENDFLRLTVDTILEHQAHVTNKGIIIFLISLVCSILAIIKLFVDMTMSVCRRKQELVRICRTNVSWIFLLISCNFIGIILLL